MCAFVQNVCIWTVKLISWIEFTSLWSILAIYSWWLPYKKALYCEVHMGVVEGARSSRTYWHVAERHCKELVCLCNCVCVWVCTIQHDSTTSTVICVKDAHAASSIVNSHTSSDAFCIGDHKIGIYFAIDSGRCLTKRYIIQQQYIKIPSNQYKPNMGQRPNVNAI